MFDPYIAVRLMDGHMDEQKDRCIDIKHMSRINFMLSLVEHEKKFNNLSALTLLSNH